MKNLYSTFSLGTSLSSQIFNATCRFRIRDILSFLKNIVEYSYGVVHEGPIWRRDYIGNILGSKISGVELRLNVIQLQQIYINWLTFLPLSPLGWRGIVVMVQGGRAIRRVNPYLCNRWRIFAIWSSMELSRPVVVHCHRHLPICPIWACHWAKN